MVKRFNYGPFCEISTDVRFRDAMIVNEFEAISKMKYSTLDELQPKSTRFMLCFLLWYY